MVISVTNTVETNDSMTEKQEYVEEANWEQEIEELKSNGHNQMLIILSNTVELHDSKTKEEEYTEEANWEQEIKKRKYENQDLPISSIKSKDTTVMEQLLQAKSKFSQQNQMLMNKNKRSQLKENINAHNNELRKAQLIYTGNDKSPDTAKLTSEQKRTMIG